MTEIPFKRYEGRGVRKTVHAISWEGLVDGSTAKPVFLPYSPDKSIQVFGDWDGATVNLLGTNDTKVITNPGSEVTSILKDTDQTPVTYGSGIQVNGGLLANPRGPIVISNNYFHNADVWMFQTTKSAVNNNFFMFDIDMFNNTETFGGTPLTVDGGAAIWEESGVNNQIVFFTFVCNIG